MKSQLHLVLKIILCESFRLKHESINIKCANIAFLATNQLFREDIVLAQIFDQMSISTFLLILSSLQLKFQSALQQEKSIHRNGKALNQSFYEGPYCFYLETSSKQLCSQFPWHTIHRRNMCIKYLNSPLNGRKKPAAPLLLSQSHNQQAGPKQHSSSGR